MRFSRATASSEECQVHEMVGVVEEASEAYSALRILSGIPKVLLCFQALARMGAADESIEGTPPSHGCLPVDTRSPFLRITGAPSRLPVVTRRLTDLASRGEQRGLSPARYCVAGPVATACRISTEAKTSSQDVALMAVYPSIRDLLFADHRTHSCPKTQTTLRPTRRIDRRDRIY